MFVAGEACMSIRECASKKDIYGVFLFMLLDAVCLLFFFLV